MNIRDEKNSKDDGEIKPLKILIATGIYPPDIGGPAQYAKNLYDIWSKQGHFVSVKPYRFENKLPTGIRHLYYFFKIIPKVISADFIIALDVFSVGLPVMVASKIFRKDFVLRTGGDFLWESYVERTGDLVLLKDFYSTRADKLNLKERFIFRVMKSVLHEAKEIIFSTEWFMNILEKPYHLDILRTRIVENFYGLKYESSNAKIKDFLAGSRNLKLKNIDRLKEIFADGEIIKSGAILDNRHFVFSDFMNRMKECYVVILISISDISPNLILDAIRCNKPFIVTKENGLLSRIKDIAIIVDPENIDDIRNKVLWLLNEENYKIQVQKIRDFNFIHTWEDIAEEIIKK